MNLSERWERLRTIERVAAAVVIGIYVLVLIVLAPALIDAIEGVHDDVPSNAGQLAESHPERTPWPARYTRGEIEALFRQYGCPGRPAIAALVRASKSDVPGVWQVRAGGLLFTVREATLVFVPVNSSGAFFCASR